MAAADGERQRVAAIVFIARRALGLAAQLPADGGNSQEEGTRRPSRGEKVEMQAGSRLGA